MKLSSVIAARATSSSISTFSQGVGSDREGVDGVLADRDRLAVEIAASLFVQFRAAPADFPSAKFARLQCLLADLGMTPAAASRVTAAPPPTRNDFEG